MNVHGAVNGYTGEVGRRMRVALAKYRKANEIVGALDLEQQKDFAKKFLKTMKEMPEDSFIGGYNAAVKRGGIKAVEEWIDGIGAQSVKNARKAAASQARLGKKKKDRHNPLTSDCGFGILTENKPTNHSEFVWQMRDSLCFCGFAQRVFD